MKREDNKERGEGEGVLTYAKATSNRLVEEMILVESNIITLRKSKKKKMSVVTA